MHFSFKNTQGTSRRGVLTYTLIAAGCLLLIYDIAVRLSGGPAPEEPNIRIDPVPTPSSSSSSEPEPESTPSSPLADYVGKLVITQERSAYSEGEMKLIVPRLELESLVMNGETNESMAKGVGLYNYSQLPNEENGNVSIVGHRDIYGKEFYYIDTITDGDLLYLEYKGMLYTYEYMETTVVKADDWDPIRVKDAPRLTLTSCDPIGTAKNRIVVTASLKEIAPIPAPSDADVSGKDEPHVPERSDEA